MASQDNREEGISKFTPTADNPNYVNSDVNFELLASSSGMSKEIEETMSDIPNVDLRCLSKQVQHLTDEMKGEDDAISIAGSACSNCSHKSSISQQSNSSLVSLRLKYKTNLADLKVKQKYQQEEDRLMKEFQSSMSNLKLRREIEVNEACLSVLDEEEVKLQLESNELLAIASQDSGKVPESSSCHGEPLLLQLEGTKQLKLTNQNLGETSKLPSCHGEPLLLQLESTKQLKLTNQNLGETSKLPICHGEPSLSQLENTKSLKLTERKLDGASKLPICHGEPSLPTSASYVYSVSGSTRHLRTPSTIICSSHPQFVNSVVQHLPIDGQCYTQNAMQSVPFSYGYTPMSNLPSPQSLYSTVRQGDNLLSQLNGQNIVNNHPFSSGIKTTCDRSADRGGAQYRLPEIKIEVFTGEIIEYPSWETAFNGLVDNKAACVEQKLNLLSQYLSGEPKELVQGYLLLQTEDAYVMAKEELKRRYGNSNLISKAFATKLKEWPNIAPHDPISIRRFSDFLNQLLAAKRRFQCLGILDYSQENTNIVAKLPYDVINLWRIEVRKYKQEKKNENAYPSFDVLVRFVYDQAENANIPELSDLKKESRASYHKADMSNRRSKVVVLSTSTKEECESQCKFCNKDHFLQDCEKFISLSRMDKKQFILSNNLCFACGSGSGHFARNCKDKAKCKICQKTHMTCFHQAEKRKTSEQTTSLCTTTSNKIDQLHDIECDLSMILPVWIRDKGDHSKEVLSYCILDEQSNTGFISHQVQEELGVKGHETSITLSTMFKSNVAIATRKVSCLEVLSYDRKVCIGLPPVYTREEIPIRRSQIPTPDKARAWPHLEKIADLIPPYHPIVPVGLLLGNNIPSVLRPREIIAGHDDQPYAQRSILGWGIVGAVRRSSLKPAVSHLIDTDVSNHDVDIYPEVTCRFALLTKTKEIIEPHHLQRMPELEFTERENKYSELSIDDSRFLKISSENIVRTNDGHFEMPLPLKSREVSLPNNRSLALRRLLQLKKRLLKDERFKNDYLLQGPNLMSNLVGILWRFRQDSIAVVSDIKSMFHQFYVKEEDRNLLRFLWWEDSNFNRSIVEFRMKSHPFGAASSPGCANFGLKRCADEGEAEYGEAAANYIRQDFYMDDGLKSVATFEEAVDLIQQRRALCASAGLKLHKFISNNCEVLESIPEDERAKDIKTLDVTVDPLPIERTLGIVWCIESDDFQFKIEIKDLPFTRRNILSSVSSIFDPVGFLAPVVLRGKMILQELCKEKYDWDDPVPKYLRSEWEKWRNEILELERLKIPRCYKPEDFGRISSVELHSFSDASEIGYGQCTYLRLTNERGEIHCSFVMGKARVAPLKQITTPRMELTAAVISAKMSDLIVRELEYKDISVFHWVDSKVVLGYINNEAKRFLVFVANRVQQIHDLSKSDTWFYIDSSANPSDDASRGISARELLYDSRWLRGPEFLWQQDQSWKSSLYKADEETENCLIEETMNRRTSN
uniref:uncharacterized protein LOC120328550 n=1 Tax=Styela clava TaxID=7725 RepID=UPI0019399470|nr:uncharacterized protein LOC120328550 [Styela clava]